MRSAAVRVFWESAQKPPGGFACAARRYISGNPILGVCG